MKTVKSFRGQSPDRRDAEDVSHKAGKLQPIRKSGKDRHSLYSELDEGEDEELDYRVRDSILDYFDDDEEPLDEEDPDEE